MINAKEYDIIVIVKLLHGAVCSYRRGFFLLFMIKWNNMLHVSKNNLKNVWKIGVNCKNVGIYTSVLPERKIRTNLFFLTFLESTMVG